MMCTREVPKRIKVAEHSFPIFGVPNKYPLFCFDVQTAAGDKREIGRLQDNLATVFIIFACCSRPCSITRKTQLNINQQKDLNAIRFQKMQSLDML